MTLQNQMIKAAKSGAKVYVIRPKDVPKIAAHATNSIRCYGKTKEELAVELRKGNLTMLGMTIKVAGSGN